MQRPSRKITRAERQRFGPSNVQGRREITGIAALPVISHSDDYDAGGGGMFTVRGPV